MLDFVMPLISLYRGPQNLCQRAHHAMHASEVMKELKNTDEQEVQEGTPSKKVASFACEHRVQFQLVHNVLMGQEQHPVSFRISLNTPKPDTV